MQQYSCMAPILLCGQRAVQGRKSLTTTAPCLALVDLVDAKLVLQVNTDILKVVVGSVLLHVDG